MGLKWLFFFVFNAWSQLPRKLFCVTELNSDFLLSLSEDGPKKNRICRSWSGRFKRKALDEKRSQKKKQFVLELRTSSKV